MPVPEVPLSFFKVMGFAPPPQVIGTTPDTKNLATIPFYLYLDQQEIGPWRISGAQLQRPKDLQNFAQVGEHVEGRGVYELRFPLWGRVTVTNRLNMHPYLISSALPEDLIRRAIARYDLAGGTWTSTDGREIINSDSLPMPKLILPAGSIFPRLAMPIDINNLNLKGIPIGRAIPSPQYLSHHTNDKDPRSGKRGRQRVNHGELLGQDGISYLVLPPSLIIPPGVPHSSSGEGYLEAAFKLSQK